MYIINKLKNTFLELKAGVLFSIFSFINRGFSFVLLLILANFIHPKQYGYLSLFSTVLMVLSFFIAMTTEGYFNISFFKESRQKFKETYTCISIIACVMSIFFIIICILCREVIEPALDLPYYIILIAIIIGFFTVFVNLNLDYYRINEKVKIYGVLSCGNALLNFILSILLVKILFYGWQGRIYAQLICFLTFGLISIVSFVKRGFITKPTIEQFKVILLWSIPLIPHMATTFIRQGCDRYIINSYHSIETVGLFSFALNLTGLITMIGFGFNQSNSVQIYKILKDKKKTNANKKNELAHFRHIYIVLYTIITFFIISICYVLIPIVLPKYVMSMNYFPLLGIYALLVCYYLIYTNFLFYYNRTKYIMYITFSSSVIHLILSLIFTRYSLHVTSFIYVFTQLFVVLLIRKEAKRELIINL